jgi:hypothetical protein
LNICLNICFVFLGGRLWFKTTGYEKNLEVPEGTVKDMSRFYGAIRSPENQDCTWRLHLRGMGF